MPSSATPTSRRVYGNWTSTIPSRFVDELPPDDIDVAEEPAPFADQGGFRGGFSDWARDSGYRLPRAGVQPPTRRFPTIDGHAFEVQPRPRPVSPFAVGERVFHQKFGYGLVLAVDNEKLEIDFEHAGTKKVMDSFVVSAVKAG